ncbi:MAG TPA: T9SS type A sorting domain-containing protein [Bacteroidia bacterium]|nr:T9SS type A sorting domain-containing protein [Bacteroidia bacterium]
MKKLLLSSAILLASLTNINAQWIPQASNITPGYYVPFLDAVDDQVVWGIVADPLAQTNPVAEYTKTVDGGNLWIGGTITNAAGLAPSCIFGLNADTAWVAMWSTAGGAGKILKTEDGGGTWNQQTTALFNAAGNFPNWVYFWDANNGICMGDPTAGYFEIYTTTDGGTNWVRTPDLDIAPEQTGEFGITDVFTHEGDSTIYFGTNQGRIYKTTDRGLHFTAAQSSFFDYIGAVAFRDANNGLCVSGGTTGSTDVSYTTDGGATWNLKGTNTSMSLILGLCNVPGTASTYFISTPAFGSALGTTYSPNDGTNWIPVDNLIHTDIEFVNDSTGWTGSNELNAPMMKWQTPIVAPADDASSKTILACANAGNFVQNPKAEFVNNGLNTVTFDVTMTITGGYTSTKTVTNLPFFVSQTIAFDPWTPATTGAYTITVYTSLTGDTNNNNDTLQKSITIYDGFENYGWTVKPDVPAGTFGLAGAFNLNGNTASSPGTYYSIGGADFAAVQATTNSFATDINAWSLAPAMPSVKYQFSAQKAGNNIYCAGGYTFNFAPDPITYFYNLPGGTWNVGPSMLVPVGDYASGVYMDTLIYYIGGYDGTADQNIVQVLNTVTNIWSTATAKPGTAVAGLRGSINGNTIIIAGGFSQILFAEVADAYIGIIDPANPLNITWNALPPYPAGPVGRLAAGTVFRDLKPLVVFVGGDPVGTTGADVLCDCWAYDIAQSLWLAAEGKPTPVNNISDFVGLVYNDSLWMASTAGYTGTVLNTTQEWLNLGVSPPLGINEHNALSNDLITLYPNPASDKLFVSIKEHADVASLKVTDVSGRMVNTTTVSKGQKMVKLSLANLDAGVYILSVVKEDGNNGGYTKFVKE